MLFPSIRLSPSPPDREGGGAPPTASEDSVRFISGLSASDAAALKEILSLTELTEAHKEKLRALLGMKKNVAREALRISRGAFANQRNGEYVGAAIDGFYRYIVDLRGDVRAYHACLNNLSDGKGLPDPIAIFTDRALHVDTPTRRDLRERLGDERAAARVREIPAKEKVDAIRVIGDSSAQAMTGLVYHLYFPKHPERPGHLCGWESLSKLLDAHNSELGKALQDRRAKKEEHVTFVLQQLGLFDGTEGNAQRLRSAAGRLRGPLSRTIKERQELAAALEAEIKEGLELLALSALSDTVMTAGGRTFKVASQARGHLMKWLSREISHKDTKENTPEWVIDAFETLTIGNGELSQDETETLVLALASYRARKTFVRKECVFGALESDLKYLNEKRMRVDAGRADDHERQIVGSMREYAAIVSSVSDLTNRSSEEIPRSRVTEVKEACVALYNFRERMCRAALEPYKEEFKTALANFEPLFKVNGTWRDDSRTNSVPLERLKKTVAGMTLSQGDFAALKEAFTLTACSPDEEAFFRSKAIIEFEEMVEGVVTAHRKVQYLLGQLPKDSQAALMAADPAPEPLPLRVYPLTGKYFTAEKFAAGHDGLTPVELLARVRWMTEPPQGEALGRRIIPQAEAAKLRDKAVSIEAVSRAGLCRATSAGLQRLDEIFHAVKDLVGSTSLQRELRVVREMCASPLLITVPYIGFDEPYLSSADASLLRFYASLEGELAKREEASREVFSVEERACLPRVLRVIAEGRNAGHNLRQPSYYRMTILDGAIEKGLAGAALKLTSRGNFLDFANAHVSFNVSESGDGSPGIKTIRFFEPEKLRLALVQLLHNYVCVDSRWCEEALLLSESKQRNHLQTIGMKPADHETWKLVRRRHRHAGVDGTVLPSDQIFVQRKLVTAVDEAFERLNPYLPSSERPTSSRSDLHASPVWRRLGNLEPQRLFLPS